MEHTERVNDLIIKPFDFFSKYLMSNQVADQEYNEIFDCIEEYQLNEFKFSFRKEMGFWYKNCFYNGESIGWGEVPAAIQERVTEYEEKNGIFA